MKKRAAELKSVCDETMHVLAQARKIEGCPTSGPPVAAMGGLLQRLAMKPTVSSLHLPRLPCQESAFGWDGHSPAPQGRCK